MDKINSLSILMTKSYGWITLGYMLIVPYHLGYYASSEKTEPALPYRLHYCRYCVGPYVLGVFKKPDEIEVIGEIGILLLMFFLGMEINVPNNRSLLIKPIIAQSMKILLSFICALAIGYITDFSLNDIILITILFIFNSTAVVSEFLKKHDTLKQHSA